MSNSFSAESQRNSGGMGRWLVWEAHGRTGELAREVGSSGLEGSRDPIAKEFHVRGTRVPGTRRVRAVMTAQ